MNIFPYSPLTTSRLRVWVFGVMAFTHKRRAFSKRNFRVHVHQTSGDIHGGTTCVLNAGTCHWVIQLNLSGGPCTGNQEP